LGASTSNFGWKYLFIYSTIMLAPGLWQTAIGNKTISEIRHQCKRFDLKAYWSVWS